jgi:hypothetical protein
MSEMFRNRLYTGVHYTDAGLVCRNIYFCKRNLRLQKKKTCFPGEERAIRDVIA